MLCFLINIILNLNKWLIDTELYTTEVYNFTNHKFIKQQLKSKTYTTAYEISTNYTLQNLLKPYVF